MRTGLIAQKEGMTRIFDEEGRQVPVTVLKVDGCFVTAVRTNDKDGYTAVQIGTGKRKASRTNKAQRGQFAAAKVEPRQRVAEFRVSEGNSLDVGAELSVQHFLPGQYVDVTGMTKGRGFTGAMKRWNFGGMRASHGVSVSHRAHGSTGQCQDPGKVFKNKKMAGHYGDERVTTQNLQVVAVDTEDGLILVKGAVPGANKGWITISDAVKRALPEGVPTPAGLRKDEVKEEPKTEEKAEEAPAEDTTAEAPAEEAKAEENKDDKAE